jgi:hypothetical protein
LFQEFSFIDLLFVSGGFSTEMDVTTGSIPGLVPTQPPIQWVPGALTPGGKVVGA